MALPKPLAKFEQFRTDDDIFLPLLHFSPDKKTDRVAIWLHGMGTSGSFYSVERISHLANELGKAEIALYAPNNRGAGIMQKLKTIDENGEPARITGGTSHELIKDVIHDIGGLVKHAKRNGYKKLYLMGHSTGANKVCVYNYHKNTHPFDAFVLFGGGDDTGLHAEQLGRLRLKWIIRQCRRQIKKGHGTRIVPKRWKTGVFSYQSLHDMLDPDGEYNVFPFWEAQHKPLSDRNMWRYWQSLRKPTLVVYGEEDEYCKPSTPTCVKLLKSHEVPGMKVDYRIIQDADHGATGHERKLAQTIAKWLKQFE